MYYIFKSDINCGWQEPISLRVQVTDAGQGSIKDVYFSSPLKASECITRHLGFVAM